MPPFRVFIAAEVITRLRTCPSPERRLITRLFDELAKDPYRAGDYVDPIFHWHIPHAFHVLGTRLRPDLLGS